MKVRFDGLDVQAMVAVLQRTVLGRRVVNIYDGDTADTYIFKLEGDGQSNTSTDTLIVDPATAALTNTGSSKEFLILESGVRFHLSTNFDGANSTKGPGGGGAGNSMPSPFVAKLRKHIRTLRFEKIFQISTDRVVVFQFGVSQYKHSIILELYAKGNLILVDKDYTILSLLRSHIYQTTTTNQDTNTDRDKETVKNNKSSITNNKTSKPQITNGDTNAVTAAAGTVDNNGNTNTLPTTNDTASSTTNSSVTTTTPPPVDTSSTTTVAAALVQVGRVYPVSFATSITNDIVVSSSPAATVNGSNDLSSSDETKQTDNQMEKNVTSLSILDMTTGLELYEWAKRQIQPVPELTPSATVVEATKIETSAQDTTAVSTIESVPPGKAEQTSTETSSTNTDKATTDAAIMSKKQAKKLIKNENKKAAAAASKTNNKKKDVANTSKVSLKNALLKTDSGVSHYGPALIEHCLLSANIRPANKAIAAIIDDNNDDESSNTHNVWDEILLSLQNEGQHVINALQEASRIETPGYILYKLQEQKKQQQQCQDDIDENAEEKNEEMKDIVLYEEFVPHLLKQHETRLHKTYTTFSHAVDEFFGSLAHQKALIRAKTIETSAATKLEKIRQDQFDRIKVLEQEQQKFYDHAKVLQVNSDNVDKAINVINAALKSGMVWDQLEQLVQHERNEKQNPIALLIHKLDLQNDCMILRLPQLGHVIVGGVVDDDKQEQKDSSRDNLLLDNEVDVKVSILDTAYANANLLFAKYRASKDKWNKTVEASSKALKAAEDATKRQLVDAQKRKRVASLMSIGASTGSNKRIYHWFEKFHWFITSDNYLVVGGRDAQQNELLVKRYLRPGDAYLHADIFGAPSCILRAKRRRVRSATKDGIVIKTEIVPLSDIALREAGNFAICYSSAWNSKMITSAWWVEPHQVSKSAPSGEYLTTGAFMIRGKKNFLPPTQLEMGLGVLFRYNDDDSDAIARHKNERRDFALLGHDDDGDDDEFKLKNVGISGTADDDDDDDINDFYAKDNNVMQQKKTGNILSSRNITTMDQKMKNPLIVQNVIPHQDTHISKEVDANNVSPTDGVPALEAVSEEEEEYVLPSIDEKPFVSECDDDQSDTVIVPADCDEGDEVSANVDSGATSSPLDVRDAEKTKTDAQEKKRGLSIRDRKLIKRYGSLQEAHRILGANSDAKDDDSDVRSIVSGMDQSVATTNTEAAKLKRGQKGKQKRIKQKYGDQDEEYRELAIQALQGGEKEKSAKKKGSSNNKKSNAALLPTAKRQEELAVETASLLIKDSESVAMKLHHDVRDILIECIKVRDNKSNLTVQDANESIDDMGGFIVRWDKIDGDTLEQLLSLETTEAQVAAAKRLLNLKQSTRVDNFSASLGGIIRTIKKYGHEGFEQTETGGGDGGKRKKDVAPKQSSKQESGINDDDEEDAVAVDDTVEIRKLTGKPHPDDSLMYCVPMCGPYSSLQHCAYRVKLTPGNMKRGRAAKQCIEMFLKSDVKAKVPLSVYQAKQHALIKNASETDWVHAICADTKISGAGASKVAKQISAKTKKSK